MCDNQVCLVSPSPPHPQHECQYLQKPGLHFQRRVISLTMRTVARRIDERMKVEHGYRKNMGTGRTSISNYHAPRVYLETDTQRLHTNNSPTLCRQDNLSTVANACVHSQNYSVELDCRTALLTYTAKTARPSGAGNVHWRFFIACVFRQDKLREIDSVVLNPVLPDMWANIPLQPSVKTCKCNDNSDMQLTRPLVFWLF